MIFYHGTTEEVWKDIQAEGILWGVPSLCPQHRKTYLAVEAAEGRQYGPVLLQVEYEPRPGVDDNYHPEAWQLRVYVPIPLSKIKRIEF